MFEGPDDGSVFRWDGAAFHEVESMAGIPFRGVDGSDGRLWLIAPSDPLRLYQVDDGDPMEVEGLERWTLDFPAVYGRGDAAYLATGEGLWQVVCPG